MKNLHKICLAPKTPVLEAMQIIDRGGAQIALIVDSQQRLLGTLTDGDVRRGLLNGISLGAPAEQLMNRDFRFVRSGDINAVAEVIMCRYKIRHVPVLDLHGRLVQLHLREDLLSKPQFSNPVVIMAGGKGTRLRPHTQNCPKPMLPVGVQPMLEIQLEQYIASGFRQFYFSVNYLKEQIIQHFSDGSRWGVRIDYLLEDEPLGTAGSLRLLPDSLKEPFLVINGDVLTRLNPSRLLQFHLENNAQATLCIREHMVSIPYGVVDTNGVELAAFEEKPTYHYFVNAGVYVIDPQLLPLISYDKATDMPSLLQGAQGAGFRVVTCPIHEYWLDIGNHQTLELARATW